MPITADELRAAAARYQTSTPSDREWGKASLTQVYLNDTPGMTIHAFSCPSIIGRSCTCGMGPRTLREWPNLFRKPVRVPSFANWLSAVEMTTFVKHTYGDEYTAFAFPSHKKIVKTRDGRPVAEVKGTSWKECLDKAQPVFHWIPRMMETKVAPEEGAFAKFVRESKEQARRLKVSDDGRVAFWVIGDQVYRAPANIHLDNNGHPAVKRWECSLNHWNRFRV